MKVKLQSYTPEPERLAACAARVCYSDLGFDELKDNITLSQIHKRIKGCMESGHLSILEHANFTFSIEGISRVTTHQLVRHRIASYSQQSQRYVKEKKSSFIIPHKILKNQEAKKIFNEISTQSLAAYNKLIEMGIKAEDARYLLPGGIETKIVVTMNARELLHFFRLRCCLRAQWEIRAMAYIMLSEVKKAAPMIFENAGPGCFSGHCTEDDEECFKKINNKLLKKIKNY